MELLKAPDLYKPPTFTEYATVYKTTVDGLVKILNQITEDNVQIGDITIDRNKLLKVLKLQDSIVTTISYGIMSWQYSYQMERYNDASKAIYNFKTYRTEDKLCVQFKFQHSVIRFFDCPKTSRYGTPLKSIPLYSTKQNKPELTGTPIDTGLFIDALNFVIHGIEKDDSRPPLKCVLLDCNDNTITFVAADGFRLPIAKMPVKGIPTQKVLIHSNDVDKLLKYLKANTTGKGKNKSYLDIYFDATESKVRFTSEKGMIELDRQSFVFPEYTKLIPTGGTKIEFIASQMLEAVKALQYIAVDSCSILRMEFSGNTAMLSAHSTEYADSTVQCDAVVESPCKIAVNYHYLLDLLRLCGDNRISLKITTSSSPMVYDIPGDKQEAIMPMFVQWDDNKPEDSDTESEDITDDNAPEIDDRDQAYINDELNNDVSPVVQDYINSIPDDETADSELLYLNHRHVITSKYESNGIIYYDLRCLDDDCPGNSLPPFGIHTAIPESIIKLGTPV